ncbi:DUF1990 domain-containing protein [Phytomonospora sp. NPDC050363]|uniref:DUF1990 family protein n=1 Tax=Phytomonospora sp. NPDC050363 TaxID=3155642 RepID=UPI0033CD9196
MDFTYPHVGITREEGFDLPQGYDRLDYATELAVPFAPAVELLFSWEVHRRAGLHPEPTAARVAPGVEVVQRFGPLRAPCRVVWAVEEPTLAGFGYGTLPGHPEQGEEAFLLTEIPGGVRFTIKAVSRPGTWYTRLARPVARAAQMFIARKYARALDVTRA